MGFDRREIAVGVNASVRLVGLLPKASLQAGYTYSFVEKFLGIPNDRSNGTVEIGYAVTRRLYVRATGIWQVHAWWLEGRLSEWSIRSPSRAR